ncbi:NAD-dependent epimerase/dehydratase family protein [Microbulbifer guangxiensis]|uniref:NAD-dependent epimerase/dehydratase family protein n=1 Tax=Microbulbifer guangxiensis TaxID=2904249 RepID=UPI001F02DDCA|nr:NAD-dependent epimerase/dehydratase family protein [Microbulbifer guangxiensis]
MARWVVFGGTGYIGAALCQQLVAQGLTVVSVSRAGKGPGECEHRSIDLVEADDFEDLFRPGDCVVYAAGLACRKACERQPELARKLNCESPLAVLRAAEEAGAHSFTYLSSVKAMTPPPGVLACESTGQPATDHYGHSKWLAEQRLLATRGNCRVNVLRPAVVYGMPAHGSQGAGGTAKLQSIFRLLGSGFALLPASGRRSMVHIGDLTAAIQQLGGQSLCDRQVFIAAEPRFYDLAAIASEISGRRVRSSRRLANLMLGPLRLLSGVAAVRRLLEAERCELYSAARLRAVLGWRPRERYSDYLRGQV